jgi:hypothetical protein
MFHEPASADTIADPKGANMQRGCSDVTTVNKVPLSDISLTGKSKNCEKSESDGTNVLQGCQIFLGNTYQNG